MAGGQADDRLAPRPSLLDPMVAADTTTTHLRSAMPRQPEPVLALRDVACRRGARILFHGVRFELHAGHGLWLRGRNGCGKTSLLRMIAGLAEHASGELRRNGVRMLYLGHADAMKADLSAAEALQFIALLNGDACAAPVLDAALVRLGLAARRDASVRTLSQGQRKRLALARLALQAQRAAALWLLDEPYDALDADGVERIDALLAQHLARGGSVVIASHQTLGTMLQSFDSYDLDSHD